MRDGREGPSLFFFVCFDFCCSYVKIVKSVLSFSSCNFLFFFVRVEVPFLCSKMKETFRQEKEGTYLIRADLEPEYDSSKEGRKEPASSE